VEEPALEPVDDEGEIDGKEDVQEWPFKKFESEDPDGGEISELEAMIFILDQMQIHKATNEQAHGFWDMMQTALGPKCPLTTWRTVKGVIDHYYNTYVQRISICVNDCIAFWDPKHTPGMMNEQHSHRSKCPKCQQPRS
jgi:hypothetical protein